MPPDLAQGGILASKIEFIANVSEINSPTLGSSATDPYLDALPAFTYAMPIQVLILGITVTLLIVLLIHLLFTIRYHLPLSKLNYAFQTTAVVLSLGNTAGQLHVLMTTLIARPRVWPFMFDFIEVTVPPESLRGGRLAGWLFLQTLVTFSVHATHIQFLTMLFPSVLEVRLILGLLGPLALTAAFLSFTDLSSSDTVIDLGDAIRNTANSALTLLYTLALFIWGLTLNRSRAWRTDGGTATFGILALLLGVTGTAVNFLEVVEERMKWLPGLVSCILLWQSWVGFWWWVGAGMWTGEAEEVEKKNAKKKRRAEAKVAKRERRERREERERAEGESAVGSARSGILPALRRRITGRENGAPEEIELREMRSNNAPAGANVTESVSSGSTPVPPTHIFSPLVALFAPFFARLRSAHDEAAVARAALPPGLPDHVRRGWGIRALMMRGRRERGERRGEVGEGEDGGGEIGAGERRAGFVGDGGERLEDDWEDDASEDSEESTREEDTTERRERVPRETGEEEEEEERGRSWWRGAVARWRVKDVSSY